MGDDGKIRVIGPDQGAEGKGGIRAGHLGKDSEIVGPRDATQGVFRKGGDAIAVGIAVSILATPFIGKAGPDDGVGASYDGGRLIIIISSLGSGDDGGTGTVEIKSVSDE